MSNFINKKIICKCCGFEYNAKLLCGYYCDEKTSLDGNPHNPIVYDSIIQCPKCKYSTSKPFEQNNVKEKINELIEECNEQENIDETFGKLFLAAKIEEYNENYKEAGYKYLLAYWYLIEKKLDKENALTELMMTNALNNLEKYISNESSLDFEIAIIIIDLYRKNRKINKAYEVLKKVQENIIDDKLAFLAKIENDLIKSNNCSDYQICSFIDENDKSKNKDVKVINDNISKLSDMDILDQLSKWDTLNEKEKILLLQNLENNLSEKENREALTIVSFDLKNSLCNLCSKKIVLNVFDFELNEILETLIKEGKYCNLCSSNDFEIEFDNFIKKIIKVEMACDNNGNFYNYCGFLTTNCLNFIDFISKFNSIIYLLDTQEKFKLFDQNKLFNYFLNFVETITSFLDSNYHKINDIKLDQLYSSYVHGDTSLNDYYDLKEYICNRIDRDYIIFQCNVIKNKIHSYN